MNSFALSPMAQDEDSSLILPIVLLLMLDGSDMMLIFALMFILM